MSGSNVPPSLAVQANGVSVVTDAQLNTYVQGAALLANARSFVGVSGMTLYLIGLSYAGDGGGGAFYWSANATTTDDGGATCIAPNGQLYGRWLRVSGSTATVLTLVLNIAALRALYSAPSALVWVDGYYAGADGGGGMFWLNAADTTSADNSGTIIVDASGQRWYRAVAPGPFPVKWFGAKVDGSTDDAVAVQNAMTAAQTAGNSGITFPAGTCVINSQSISWSAQTATQSVSVSGAGSGVSTLLFGGAHSGLLFNYYASNGTKNSVKISGLSLLCASAGVGVIAIVLTAAASPNGADSMPNLISDVIISGSDFGTNSHYWSFGVYAFQVSQLNVANCKFINGASITGSGVLLVSTVTYPGVQYNFTGCAFQYCNLGLEYGQAIQGVTVSQCNFTDCNYGIDTAAGLTGLTELVVTASQFQCNLTNIFLDTVVTNLIVSGNLIYVNTSGFGIFLSTCSVATISGNCIDTGGAIVQGVGLHITATSNPAGTIVTGNSFFSLNTGVDLHSGTYGVNVQSNTYFNCITNVSDAGTGNVIGGGSS